MLTSLKDPPGLAKSSLARSCGVRGVNIREKMENMQNGEDYFIYLEEQYTIIHDDDMRNSSS